MRVNKDIAMLIQTLQDATMVAEACRDFYLECYERTNERSAFLFGDEPADPQWDGYPIPLNDIDGNGFYADLYLLKQKLDGVQEGDINDDADAKLFIPDFWNSSKTYVIYASSVAEQLGQQSDSNYIMYAAFQAMLDSKHSKATTFFQNILLYAQGKSQAVADALVKVHQYVGQGDTDMASANEALLNFGGVTQFISNPENGNNYDCDLQQFTGTQPINGVFTGLVANAKTLLGKAGALFLYQYEVAFKMIGATIGLVAKGVKKLFSWISNWFTTTYVDPVDFKITDDSKTMTRFCIPGKIRYNAAPGGKQEGPVYHRSSFQSIGRNFVQLLNKGEPCEYWFSFLGTKYRITPDDGFPTDENATYGNVVLERWLKPLSVQGLLTVLTENDFSTIGGLRYAMHALQRSDLSLDGKVSELELLKGMLLAHAAETAIRMMLQTGKLKWLYRGSVNNPYWEAEAPSDDTIITSQDEYGYYAIQQMLVRLRSAAYDLKNNWDNDQAQIPFATGYVTFGAIKEKYMPIISDERRVTNKTLLQLSTAMLAGSGLSSEGIDTMIDCTSSTYQYGGPILEYWETQAYWSDPNYVPPAPAPMILWNSDRSARLAYPDDRIVTIGYHHGQDSADANIGIKTDSENIEAATKATTNAIITIAAIAVTVYIGVKAVKLLKTIPKWQSTVDTMRFNYGDAIAKGDVAGAEAIWKAQKALTLKLRCANIVKGALLGGPQLAANAVSSMFRSDKSAESASLQSTKQISSSVSEVSDKASQLSDQIDDTNEAITESSKVNEQNIDEQTKALVAAMAAQSALDVAETVIIINKLKKEVINTKPSENVNGNW